MSRAMAVARGLLLSAAVLPGVAMASLTAANPRILANVAQGTAVTKSVTVTSESPGWHYLMGETTSGTGRWATSSARDLPKLVLAPATVSACQISGYVSPQCNSTSLGSEVMIAVSIWLHSKTDMPLIRKRRQVGWTKQVVRGALSYTIVEAAPESCRW